MEDAPVVKLINAILTDAVKRGASDIHFECFEHDIRVRYRIDGALQEVMKPPMKLKAALISRFKIMAQLNIAERRVPQDGRIKLKMGRRSSTTACRPFPRCSARRSCSESSTRGT